MSFHPKMAYDATFQKSARPLEDEGPAFVYTAANRARFDEIVRRYPPDRRRSAVLPALYLAQHQQGYITANAIRAGVTDTPALRKIPGNEKLVEIATLRNPHHRLTTPADLGGAIVALTHPGADWITGNVINVDGGEEVSA